MPGFGLLEAEEMGIISDISIPQVRIPFTPRVNPFYRMAARHTTRWAGRLELITPRTADRFAGESYARLVSRLYPEASLPDLTLAADLNSWFHVYDDRFELTDVGSDPALATLWVEKTDAILSGDPPDKSEGPLLRGLADIRDRFRMRASDSWWERFAANFRRCFRTAVWEVQNRANGTIPDPGSYVSHKLEIAYVPPSFDVIEFVEHFDVPDAIRDSAPYSTLVHEAGHVVVCTNDLIGLRRELAQGEFHNLVIVLANDLGCSLQAAIELVNETIATRMDRFLAAKKELDAHFTAIEADEHVRDGTLRCVVGLEHWMRGYLDWAMESRRFSDPVLRGQVASFRHELTN
jgi:5-epi-alpha-selinene synthase